MNPSSILGTGPHTMSRFGHCAPAALAIAQVRQLMKYIVNCRRINDRNGTRISRPESLEAERAALRPMPNHVAVIRHGLILRCCKIC